MKYHKILTLALCAATVFSAGVIPESGLCGASVKAFDSNDDNALQIAKREYLETSRKRSYEAYAGIAKTTRDARIKAEEEARKEERKKEQEAALLEAKEKHEQMIAEAEAEAKKKAEEAAEKSIESTVVLAENPVISESARDITGSSQQAEVYVDSNGDSFVLDSDIALLTSAVIDSEYSSEPLQLTSSNRDNFERLVMGEAGNEGFAGAAIVAQSIRDNMRDKGVYDLLEIKSMLQYSGSLNKAPNSDVKKACEFILDDGGMALQHRVLYFYAPRWCQSTWHESQIFLIEYGGHRVFDRR